MRARRVGAVVLLALVLAGCTSGTSPAEPSTTQDAGQTSHPAPSPSAKVESPGPEDHPAAVYGAGSSLVLATERTDQTGTATVWRKDQSGWQRLGTLEHAVPKELKSDGDGIHFSPGPGSEDIIATGLAGHRVGFSRDGGTTWTYVSPSGWACSEVARADCYFNVTSDYLYWSTGEERVLRRLGFGASSAEDFSLPRSPDPENPYRFPLVLDDGTLLSAESADGFECNGYYRFSRDHGDTWSERRGLPESTCVAGVDGNTAYACDPHAYDGCHTAHVFRSTDLVHWRSGHGWPASFKDVRPCPGWHPGHPWSIEYPVRVGDEFFTLFHLNYRGGHEIRPRQGMLQEGPHRVEHVLMVSHDRCRSWQKVLPSADPPTPPAATPPSMPEGDARGDGAHIPIQPGTYLLPRSAWSVADFTVTFPEEWTVQYGHAFARHHDQKDEFGFYAVVVDEIYVDACRGERGDVVTVGPGVQDLVDALLGQPGPAKRGPVHTTLGGYPAIRIDLSIPPRLQRKNCFMGPGTGVQVWYSGPADKYFVLLPDAVARVYVIDVNGKPQVFLAQLGNPGSTRDRAELQSVLDSIRIRPQK